MTLPPAYQFPTTALFLDDDLDFITSIQKSLHSKTTPVEIFDDPKEALARLRANATVKTWDGAWTSIHSSENNFDSIAVEVNFSKISTILKDPKRFNHITSVIVDYHMPDLDGLTFLGLLKGIPVKRVLLTGIDDAEIAVKALERGLIDAYLRKHDPNMLDKIGKTITNFQQEYFLQQSNLINLAMKIANNKDAALRASYCDLFRQISEEHKAIEHYLIDENGSCMFIDEESNRLDLIIKSHEQLSNDLNELRPKIGNFRPLPIQPVSQFFYSVEIPSALSSVL